MNTITPTQNQISSISKKIGRIKKKSKKPNFKGWYLSTGLTQTSNAMIDPFFPLFAKSIGASNAQIGLLSGLMSLISISQILWTKLSQKVQKSSIFVFIGQFISFLLFIPYLFLRKGEILLLVVLRFFQGFFLSAAVPNQANLMSDHIPENERATVITRFTRLGMIGGLVGSLLGGAIFTIIIAEQFLSEEDAYKFIFLLTLIFGIIASLIFFRSVTDKQIVESIDSINLINRDLLLSTSKLSFTKKFTAYLKKFKNFWIFVVTAFIFYFSVYAASPFFIVLEIESFGFSFLDAAILTAISLIIQIIVAMFLEKTKLLDLIGRKKILILGNLILIIATVLILLPYFILQIPKFLWCIFAWSVLGCGWGFFNSAIAVTLLDIVHPKYRAMQISYYNTIIGLAQFFGPVIGGLLIDFYSNNLIVVFIFRIIILILTFIPLFFVIEPEIPGIVFKPVRNVFPQLFRFNAAKGPDVVVSYGQSNKVRQTNLSNLPEK
ncbi:MAG: MFS transporter [Candidatus Thorarchaeota archaeon]